jgi:hypothetical protein
VPGCGRGALPAGAAQTEAQGGWLGAGPAEGEGAAASQQLLFYQENIWLDRATSTQFGVFGHAATCTGSFCVFGPALSSPARQDSMDTPGNFGGGSTGPDQIFLGITRAPPSAPGRGRAQRSLCDETRTPRPQSTRGSHESGSQSRFPIPAELGGLCQFG